MYWICTSSWYVMFLVIYAMLLSKGFTVFSALRIFAIWSGSRGQHILSVMVLILQLTPVATNAVCTSYREKFTLLSLHAVCRDTQRDSIHWTSHLIMH